MHHDNWTEKTVWLRRTLKVSSSSKQLVVMNQAIFNIGKVTVKLSGVSAVITPALSCENTDRFLSSRLLRQPFDILIPENTWKSLQSCFSVTPLNWQKIACCGWHKLFQIAKSHLCVINTLGPRQILLNTLRLLLDLILLPALQHNNYYQSLR